MTPEDHERVEEREATAPFYIPAVAVTTTQNTRVLKRGDIFAVLDYFGGAQASGPAAEGLFFEDTRYLAQLALTINDTRPLLLSSSVTGDNIALSADLTNPDLEADGSAGSTEARMVQGSVHILATTVLGADVLFQTIELRNFSCSPLRFRFAVNFAADFADLFEVRGAARLCRGEYLPDERLPDSVALAYRGLDGVTRRTRLAFDPAPHKMMPGRAFWEVTLPAGGRRTIELAVRCERDGRVPSGAGREVCIAEARTWRAKRRSETASLTTDNESCNTWLDRSRADLDMLITETPYGLYPYAGIPWFSTAFGRDGIITALQCLWLDPGLAAGTLRFLAAHQATALDPKADAEPGKILHETRKGEMAMLGEVPFARYYGGVDATPLFVVLAAAYYERTGDLPLVRVLWPHIEAALRWMREYGDLDGDGFLEYDRKSLNGLINQGWKDSADSIFHADGRLAEAPIALAEVQAYAYAAYLGAAKLAAALGETERAGALPAMAEHLRQRFEEAFWIEENGTYALALDGQKRPCRVVSSNAGHVLMGGLASQDRAARVAEGLMGTSSFSRWGIRTVAETAPRYNPMSYHNGSVWPHDNALIGIGFARYGLRKSPLAVLSALYDAALFMEHVRLPELFCGFERRPCAGPTSYPVACMPQAWASASVFGLFGAVLGISFDTAANRILFTRPALPNWLDECAISNLRLGDAAVDLTLRRNREQVALHVVNRTGPVEIVVVN
jgi:glycogen debranching enzyme